MNMPPAIPVTFYTKPGCHLCEDVAAELEALSRRWPLAITAVDITADLELHRRYWDTIPVLVLPAETLAAPITPEALAEALERAAQQREERGHAG